MMIRRNKKAFGVKRHQPGQMNKTEAAYATHLNLLKSAGKIYQWWFEAIKLKIADHTCWWTPDFLVQLPDGSLELHDVKGNRTIVQDDALVKMKSCATQYPYPVVMVWPDKALGWKQERYE